LPSDGPGDPVGKQLAKTWDDTLFEQHYLPAVLQEEQAIAQHDAFAFWLGHLCDAFESVDWRSGEIRDLATATSGCWRKASPH
jgi:hypothetical protein